jgi:hypothetical protein
MTKEKEMPQIITNIEKTKNNSFVEKDYSADYEEVDTIFAELEQREPIEFSSLSIAEQKAIKAGIESFEAGRVLTNWGDFAKYINNEE